VALISTLINKTKMLEFGANFIGHMIWYEIPITKKKCLEKTTKSSRISKSVQKCDSKQKFETSVLDT
jgi:hypothetical protein